MKTRHLLALAAITLTALSGCKKDPSDYQRLILGDWTSTAESADITIAGAQPLPEGTIHCHFDEETVEITDMRCDCLPEKNRYTLEEEGGTLWLTVKTTTTNVFYSNPLRVTTLTKERLVLEDGLQSIDAGFGYAFEH